MATFEKIDRMNVEFPQNDIKDIHLSGGTYTSNLYINTTTGQTVELRFSSIADFKSLLEMLVAAVLRTNWADSYPGAFVTAVEGRWSVEDIQKWKKHYEDTESDSRQQAQSEEPPF